MARYLISIAIGICLITTDCSKGVDVEAQRQMLLDTDRAMATAAAAGDTNRVFPYWTDDAVIYPAGMPVVRGKKAIRDFVAMNRTQPGFSINWNPLEAVVSPDGNIGYTTGNYEVWIQGPDSNPKIRKGRYLQTWRKDDTGLWKCIVEIQSPLSMQAGSDVRPGWQFENKELVSESGNDVSGTLTSLGSPLEPPVRIDAGKGCIVEVRWAYTISGTLSGSIEINYRIMVAGPCGSPPGTFDENWIAYGSFDGLVDGISKSGKFSYTANVKAGGDVEGTMIFGQGIDGELKVKGNFNDGKLSYKGRITR
jgi:ketosteroid isomerase-like protein